MCCWGRDVSKNQWVLRVTVQVQVMGTTAPLDFPGWATRQHRVTGFLKFVRDVSERGCWFWVLLFGENQCQMPSPHKEYGLNSIFQRNFGLETLFHVKHCTFPHFSKNIHILLRCRGTLEAQWEGRYSTHWAELSCLEISPGERSKAEGAEGRALGLILNLCWAEAAAKSPPNISTSQFPLPDQKELEGSPSASFQKVGK